MNETHSKLMAAIAKAEDKSYEDEQLAEPGEHVLELTGFTIVEPEESDQFVKASFIVKESSSIPIGRKVFTRWYALTGKAVVRRINQENLMKFVKSFWACKDQQEASEKTGEMLRSDSPAGVGNTISCRVRLTDAKEPGGKQWPKYKWFNIPNQNEVSSNEEEELVI